ncbi:hypothetical protein [Brevibacillus daliensis]|uniref:hypothetical protein n=1 Tax=Brevibacillus daliensis TaxID=2892995 RepID=UPI001E43349F|nr:hypothetical protein [Brevibacillus daliensis]
MLHRLFQLHHIPPDEVYAKDPRHRLFLYASELLVIEEEREQEKARKSRKGGRQ